MQTHFQCQKVSQGLSGNGGGTGRWEKQGSQRGRETPLGVTVCSHTDDFMSIYTGNPSHYTAELCTV